MKIRVKTKHLNLQKKVSDKNMKKSEIEFLWTNGEL